MNRWDAFVAVCGHLRAGLLGGEPRSLADNISWELLVEASSHHRVTPTLAWCLNDRADVPAEVREYLDGILALNSRRNKALLAGLQRIVAACNAVGIEPVPLKGAARLVERNYPASSLRFLGDLDVLIPEERAVDVVAALRAGGFREKPGSGAAPSDHHLPMLYDGEGNGGVELHTELTSGDGAEVMPTSWFNAGTGAHPWQNLQIRLPDPTRSVGHVVVHDQLQHGGYRERTVELRQVLDIAVIRAAHESAIDWADLDRRFRRAGHGEVLATYLEMGEVLLGQPAPRLSCAPRPHAIEDFRRSFEWRRSQLLASIVKRYVALRRQNPRGLLRLLDRRSWPVRIRMVMNAFNKTPANW